MSPDFLKWPLRLAIVKCVVGMLILVGLVVTYLDGTDRPRTYYVAMAATVLAVVLWARKVIVLHQAKSLHK